MLKTPVDEEVEGSGRKKVGKVDRVKSRTAISAKPSYPSGT